MSSEAPDLNRRRFLTGAATVVGGVGLVFTAVPFLSYLRPSARALAAGAPVELDISKLEVGRRIEVEWRGRPVWVIGRSQEQIDALEDVRDRLRDPDSEVDQQPEYARNPARSVKPDVAVLVGVCTHLGCAPGFHPEIRPQHFDQDWRGGFFCACHGSMFDMAGRVYRGVPAPTNLVVPPHRYVGDDYLVVGEDPTDEGGTA